MNTGVSIAPCAVSSRPARARAGRCLQRELHRGDCSSARMAPGASAPSPGRQFALTARRVMLPLALRVPPRSCAREQHRVAVAVEAVALGDRVCVGETNVVVPSEGRDEHQQCRFRHVEVGQESVDDAEAVARRDEQTRFAVAGRERGRIRPRPIRAREGSSCRSRRFSRLGRAPHRWRRRSRRGRDSARRASGERTDPRFPPVGTSPHRRAA